MKMIVGLGNPGKEYENTRHNIGFMLIDHYLQKHNIDRLHEKFNGAYQKLNFNNTEFIILKPLSYMNLSGEVVRKYAQYFKINHKDILIIQDDLDMPLGKIKLKSKGSSGGHNGIKNIIDNMNTLEIPRFKVGIGKDKKLDTKDYVLGKFDKKSLEQVEKIKEFSNDIIDDFLTKDFEKLMSKYNGEQYEIK